MVCQKVSFFFSATADTTEQNWAQK